MPATACRQHLGAPHAAPPMHPCSFIGPYSTPRHQPTCTAHAAPYPIRQPPSLDLQATSHPGRYADTTAPSPFQQPIKAKPQPLYLNPSHPSHHTKLSLPLPLPQACLTFRLNASISAVSFSTWLLPTLRTSMPSELLQSSMGGGARGERHRAWGMRRGPRAVRTMA